MRFVWELAHNGTHHFNRVQNYAKAINLKQFRKLSFKYFVKSFSTQELLSKFQTTTSGGTLKY